MVEFRRQKTAADAALHSNRGRGLIKVNEHLLGQIYLESHRAKHTKHTDTLSLGSDGFFGVGIRVRVKGRGHKAEIDAIKQVVS